jgi:hypothetical protein
VIVGDSEGFEDLVGVVGDAGGDVVERGAIVTRLSEGRRL